MRVTPQVTLLEQTGNPASVLFTAYQTCYSAIPPEEIWDALRGDPLSGLKVQTYLERQFAQQHESPRQQVYFTFALSNTSRVNSHQLVRHHTGITFDQQSQRYVKFDTGDFPFVIPPSILKDNARLATFLGAMQQANQAYLALRAQGVPTEDARYVFPEGSATNLIFTVNLQEIIHIADQRLCTRSQWEIRRIWSQVRNQVGKVYPFAKKYIAPRCSAHRQGYCDERYAHYQACPLSKVRPHKKDLLEGYALQRVPLRADSEPDHQRDPGGDDHPAAADLRGLCEELRGEDLTLSTGALSEPTGF